MVKLSAVVIAENEEAVIGRCLASLSFCDEIVLVDGGSRDRTIEIAESHRARVIRHSSSTHGIHFNKNLGADEAKGEWILSIDADEEVSPALAREIGATITDARFSCYRVPRRTYFVGEWIRHCGWWPGYVIRLWRKGRTKWPLEVHGVPQADGECGTLAEPLEHYSYANLAEWLVKVGHFSGCEAEEAVRGGRVPGKAKLALALTLQPAIVFARKLVRQSAWRDGFPGLVVAGSAAVASWLRAARLWEILQTGVHPDLGGREGRKRE